MTEKNSQTALPELYDGTLLHRRFAYRYFRDKVLPIGNILAFIGPMVVEAEGMIDVEDVLNNDFIYSEKAINFVWEIPGIDIFGAIAFQRLFNTAIANKITGLLDVPVEVDGDDIIIHREHEQGGIVQQKGKASVSITCLRDGAALGHTGLNIKAGKKAPAFAFSITEFEDPNLAQQFIKDVNKTFYDMSDDIFVASTKVI